MAENINKSNFNTSAAAVTAVTTQSHSPSSPNQSNPATKPVPAWTRIVRGEPDPNVAVTLSSLSSPSPSTEEGAGDGNAGPNGNAGKRPAWNKPSNVVSESGPVIEAGMWPPLAESARVPKSSSDSSDGSSSVVPFSQGSRTATSSSSSQKQFRNNGSFNSNSTANYMMPARQRPMKQNSNVSASNGGLSHPPPQGPMIETPLRSTYSRDYIQRTGFVSHSGGGNDHPHPRNSFRHRNSGLNPRGNSSHHPNYGERRNQDHGNQDLTGLKFNGRDSHMQLRVVPSPRFMRPVPPPPPNTGSFFASPQVPPFGTPTGFPDFYLVPVPHPESLRGVPFIQAMPPMFRLVSESHVYQLHARIMNQIDYYFSNENLIKDTYLRQNMDDQGWVPIKLIAGFRKVSLLTDNIQVILDVLRSSESVEVQGDKIRKRDDWMRWVLPHPVEFPTKSGQEMLVARVHNLSLDKGTTNNRSGAMSQGGASADGQDGNVVDGPASD